MAPSIIEGFIASNNTIDIAFPCASRNQCIRRRMFQGTCRNATRLLDKLIHLGGFGFAFGQKQVSWELHNTTTLNNRQGTNSRVCTASKETKPGTGRIFSLTVGKSISGFLSGQLLLFGTLPHSSTSAFWGLLHSVCARHRPHWLRHLKHNPPRDMIRQ